MKTNFYLAIKEEIEAGNLTLICIISPARAGSTLMMNVLAQSPSIHSFINQPFHLTYSHPYTPPISREEMAYGRIWKKYQQVKEITNQKTVTIILKCMARNLGIGQQLLRFMGLVKTSILLIRNPVLTVESLLKAQVLVIEDMPEASPIDLEEYAAQKEVVNHIPHRSYWSELRDFILETKRYHLISDVLAETLAFIELNRYESTMVDDYQRDLEVYGDRDFFALSWTGWNNMQTVYECCLVENKNYFVVDSTIFRCLPEEIGQRICQKLDVVYSPHMVRNWSAINESVVDDDIIQVSWMKVCYNKVSNSLEVYPPKESPIEIDLFPAIYQQHISETAYPNYLTMLGDRHTLRPQDRLETHMLLNIPITENGDNLRSVDPIFTEALLSIS